MKELKIALRSEILHAPPGRGYDIVFLSDLLHFHSSHHSLVKSLISLLDKISPNSRAYVAAGKYTPPHVCDNFLSIAKQAGISFTERTPDSDEPWLGSLKVQGLTNQDLSDRKGNCRWWIGRWAV
jgi:EEF1A N-terminal glycine/lysine methyltransferase